MSEWSDLPNARHIDRVLATLKEHPEIWAEAYTATWGEERDAVRNATKSAASDADWNTGWQAAWNTVWYAVRDANWNADRQAACTIASQEENYDAARGSTNSAILALLVYDDCDQYLNMSSEELKTWALITQHPAAVLLLSAVVALELIAELETV